MKNFKSIATAALLAVSLSASAQFTNSGSSTKSTSVANTNGWSTIWVQWNPSKIKIDRKEADDKSFTGLSFGYSQAFNITPSLPLFVEAGLGIQYSFHTEKLAEELADEYNMDEEDLEEIMDPKEKFNLFSVKIPVNLTYKFDIPNSSFSIAPYFGLTMRFNLSGKAKMEYNLTSDAEDHLRSNGWSKKDIEETFGDKDRNLFDKKDMGSDKNTWKRFQLGWQLGVNARIKDTFLVGVSYGTDFSEIAEKSKVRTTSITLGYTF